jgi:hypothetical protein
MQYFINTSIASTVITVIMNGCFIYFIPNLKLLGPLVQSRDFHLAFIFFRDFHFSFILHGFFMKNNQILIFFKN